MKCKGSYRNVKSMITVGCSDLLNGGDTFCKPKGQSTGSSVKNRVEKLEGACGFLIWGMLSFRDCDWQYPVDV